MLCNDKMCQLLLQNSYNIEISLEMLLKDYIDACVLSCIHSGEKFDKSGKVKYVRIEQFKVLSNF
jgi:hypothetical protein